MNELPVRFHPEAQHEILQALQWYQKHHSILKMELEEDLIETLHEFLDRPGIGALISNTDSQWEVRKYLLRRYPYALVVVLAPDNPTVLAFTHLKRKPHYWQKRLEQ